MGGDLFQWNEANYDSENLYRGLRGGGWFISSSFLESSGRYDYGSPTGEYYYGGFRVASVPTGWVHPDPGDANGDGKVDINDLTIVLTNYDKTAMAWSQGDFIGNGTVDINDLTVVLANYNTTYSASIKAVPEPSSVLLIGVAVLGLAACAAAGEDRLSIRRTPNAKGPSVWVAVLYAFAPSYCRARAARLLGRGPVKRAIGLLRPRLGYVPLDQQCCRLPADARLPGQRHKSVCLRHAHAVTFNMVFCDGSVHPISYSIHPLTHHYLGSRNDGHAIDGKQW